MNQLSPILSVIVPAYNVENYIEQCILSICNQSYNDFEIILVDDGSTDSTGNICDIYAEKDPRIRVVHKLNGGLVSARKTGLSVAQGEYVVYVDGDDWIAKEMFEELLNCARNEKVDVVISDFVSVLGDQETLLTQNMEYGFYDKLKLTQDVYPYMLCGKEYFSFGFQPSLCSKLFKRSLISKYQNEVDNRIRLGEDAACVYPLLLEAESIFYLKEKYVYYYRMRETSISHTIVHSYYTDEIILLLNHLKKQFDRWNKEYGLNRELNLYGCYMLDNMVSQHLNFTEIFLKRDLSKQFEKFYSEEIGKEVFAFCQKVRTSSRMKRVLGMVGNKSVLKKINLFLFCIYEKWDVILLKKRANMEC